MNIFLRQKWKIMIIAMTIVMTVSLTEKRVERIGDNLQMALPLLGFACAITNGKAIDYTVRFVAMEVILHSSKNGLGDAKINQRPTGGLRGFPSGHTTAAAYGASSLVHSCIKDNLWAKGAVILTAGYVGGSRIEAGKHTMFQVLFGALLGWLADRLFRSGFGSIKRYVRNIKSRLTSASD
jgi:membrane-associated phospholipid phosphatase